MWDSLKPDWSVIKLVLLGMKINTLDVSKIELKEQLGLIKSKIVS